VVAPSTLRLPDGRTLAYDDVGDPAGTPVVYLHGTPDSRLGRPADDVSASAGVRLVAVDRPGAGDSDVHVGSTLRSLGHDLAVLLDELGLTRVLVVGWSGGGLAALGATTVLEDRVAGLGLVAPLPPVEAYAEPGLVSCLAPGRRAFAELFVGEPPRAVAADVVPLLVPDPMDAAVARQHVLEQAGERGRGELASVPGAVEALTEGLAASVRSGHAGLEEDVAQQLEPGLDLSRITCPVRTFHGAEDGLSPPEVGAWLVSRLPNAVLDLSPEAGHHLLFPRWRGILRALQRDAAI
jgi:pimeloyl-ACP methyl ester carboxylesterase